MCRSAIPGYVLSGNSELQSLTLGGVGSGTTIDHIDSHNSSDDGFEIFGGRVNLRYFVITGADDDNIDVDTGYQGTIQYVIAVQKTSGAADSMIELDSPGTNSTTDETQTPRTNLKLANFTLRSPQRGFRKRRCHAIPWSCGRDAGKWHRYQPHRRRCASTGPPS